MMKIIDIYKKYSIPPQLQLHQLRVASVAKLICDNLTIPVETYEAVSYTHLDVYKRQPNVLVYL